MGRSEHQRLEMVKRQIVGRGVKDPRVLAAMREVPREAFVPEEIRERAYEDGPLPIGDGQTISQPYVVAWMVEALDLGEGDRVLEIGAGSGYAAAVLASLAHQVYTVERLPALADSARQRLAALGYDNVEVRCDDGTLGWEEHAPYDAILVSAGAPEVPANLLDQLAEGGRLVIPVGEDRRVQRLLRYVRKDGSDFEHGELGRVQFVPLIGSGGWDPE